MPTENCAGTDSGMGQHGGMPGGASEDPPRVRSWITPKAAKGGASAIEGQGVHAVEVIAAGEVVAVKGATSWMAPSSGGCRSPQGFCVPSCGGLLSGGVDP